MSESILHLTLDNGNSNPHVGIFRGHSLEGLLTMEEFLRSYSLSDLKKRNIPVAISNVGSGLDKLAELKETIITFDNFLCDGKFLDMKTEYAQTIGNDRLFQSYYVFKQEIYNQKSKILLIDSGTFTTLDYITFEGHLGGHIIPGVNILAEGYRRGALLSEPTTNELMGQRFEIPKTTKSAICNGAALLIKSFLDKAISNFKPTQIIITGGRFELIESLIDSNKPKVQVKTAPNLIHHSLSYLISKSPGRKEKVQ